MRSYSYTFLHGRPRSEAEIWGSFFVVFSVVCWGSSFYIGFRNAIAILSLLGFVFSLVGLRRPSVGLIGISVLCALDVLTRVFLTGLIPWNALNYWLLLVMAFSFSLLFRLNDPQTRLLVLFLLILVTGLFFSSFLEYGLQHILGILITFGILAYFIRAMHNPDAWYWSAVVTSWLASVGGLVYFTQPGMLQEVNANAWGFFPLTAIISTCLAAQIVPDQKYKPFILYALTFVNFVWVFLSGSRGDITMSLICIIVLLLANKGLSKRISFLVLGVLIVLIVLNQFDHLRQVAIYRIDKIFDPQYTVMQRTSGRSDLIKAGWYMFLDNPITGIGTGSFASEWAEIGSMGGRLSFSKIGDEMQAHSGWIKVLAENGVFGFLLLAGFVISFAVTGLRKKSFPIVGLLVTGCLMLAFSVTEFQGKGLWYLAAGGVVLINRQGISKHLIDWERSRLKLGHSNHRE